MVENEIDDAARDPEMTTTSAAWIPRVKLAQSGRTVAALVLLDVQLIPEVIRVMIPALGMTPRADKACR